MTEYELAIEASKSTPSFKCDIFQNEPSVPLYYQYRNFDSFWSIIKSDCFWATDARFSNDSEEQRFGAKIMHRLRNTESDGLTEINEDYEDYIVCFCGEDDKLSQWRGYASKGGVSIGFDFNAAVPFCVILKDKEFGAGLSKKDYRTVFGQLGQVCYLPPELPPDLRAELTLELSRDLNKEEEDKSYCTFCADAIGCPDDIHISDEESRQAFLQALRKSAPFIKHEGFKEENEYRLVFRNEDGQLSKCVRYHPADSNGIQGPFIVVRPGNPGYDREQCVVRICLEDAKQARKLWDRLRTELKKPASLVNCRMPPDGAVKRGYTDRACFGCTRRLWVNGSSVSGQCHYGQSKAKKEYNWGTHAKENSVIISQGQNQEEVFEKVHVVVKELVPSVPVWCEGHLPIRSITVGPCTYQQEAAENICHYIRHVYWLRDVKIKVSRIPYRRSI